MNDSRKKLNAIRAELSAVRPSIYTDPLPPQPSILPAPPILPDSIIVRSAKKVDRIVSSHPKIKYTISRFRPKNIKTRNAARHHNKLEGLSFPSVPKATVSIIIPVFNKFDMTLSCLQSLKTYIPASITYEVIILDNGSSDETESFLSVPGLHYIRSATNLGFVGGCNFAANRAKGAYLVFLNNDALITEGWLENLVETLENYPNAGIVGSKIVYPDGRLQEAGGIIFSDGTGNNYGKNDHPYRYQYNYVREVDYCSGASIIIRRTVFGQLHGFDTLYQPAYYEDTDLAFRVRKLGLKVVYQPKSTIYHIEGATAGTDMTGGFKKFQAINHEKFVNRWKKTLLKEQLSLEDLYKARDRTHQKLFLIIDEHVPTPDKDAGSVRTVAIIEQLQILGYKVTLFPNYSKHQGKYTERLAQNGVEIVYGQVSFEDFIQQYGKYYDVIMMSRPRIGSYYIELCESFAPQAQILYDTVDLHYLRLGRQSNFETGELKKYYTSMAEKHRVLEHYLIEAADTALVVSEIERSILVQDGYKNVEILSLIYSIREDAYAIKYSQRKDLLFVGGYAHPPNVDAVNWFVDEVFPLIVKLDPKIKIHIVGAEMPDTLKDKLKTVPNVIVEGFVEDLSVLLKSCRVFVAPMRYGAGIKGKIGQAVESGMPVVTTTIGSEGMHLKNNESCLEADEADTFAKAVVKLYSDPILWKKVQNGAKTVIHEHFSATRAQKDLRHILKINGQLTHL